jgi:Holliday junction resolvase RusA-like endonuclease
MATYTLVIPGEARPEAKRQRLLKFRDGRVAMGSRTDLPDRKDWKGRVAVFAATSGIPLLRGPLAVTIIVQRVRPASWPKKPTKGNPWPGFAWRKPDVENLGKPIHDALTGVVWVDDAQIVDARQVKCWGPCDEVHVVVTELVQDGVGMADRLRLEGLLPME